MTTIDFAISTAAHFAAIRDKQRRLLYLNESDPGTVSKEAIEEMRYALNWTDAMISSWLDTLPAVVRDRIEPDHPVWRSYSPAG